MEQLSSTELQSVSGGVSWSGIKAGTKAIGRRLPGINQAAALWDGYSGYSDARAKGKGVGESLGEGVKEAVKGATWYDLWGPTPAY